MSIIVKTNVDPSANSYSNEVVSDFLEGLHRAYELASTSTGMRVSLLLERGTHVITPAQVAAYNYKRNREGYVDYSNPTFSLVIRPYLCADDTNSLNNPNGYACSETITEDSVRILNKVAS